MNTTPSRETELATILSGLTLDVHEIAIRAWSARLVREAGGAAALSTLEETWVAMTGLDTETALDLAMHIVSNTDTCTAAVVPF